MIGHYLVSTYRGIKKYKLHTFLNVVGFSIGIAATMLVALFAKQQLSVDAHQKDANRIYRIHEDFRSVGQPIRGAINSRLPLLMQSHTDIESMMILTRSEKLQFSGYPIEEIVSIEGQAFKLPNFYTSTKNIPEFIDIKVLFGSLEKSLSAPNYLAISQSQAHRLFGRIDVVGEVLKHDSGNYQITAVFADFTDNTHFAFDVLTLLPKLQRGPFGSHIYVKLKEGAKPKPLAQHFTDELHKRARNPAFKEVGYNLVPLRELNFNTNGASEMKQGRAYIALQISISLSIILLLIATINFINFTIAAAAKRAKEVGIRKSLGATKNQLMALFMLEALILVGGSGFIALVLVECTLPYFNALLGSQLVLSYFSPFMMFSILILVCIALITGLYPALLLSSFNTKRVLSGDLSKGKSAAYIRKLTLCFQNMIAISLLIGVWVLYQQTTLIQLLNVGFEKQNRLMIKNIPTEAISNQNNNVLLNELKQIKGVQNLALSDTHYATAMHGGMHITWPNGETPDGMLATVYTSHDVINALGLNLLAGRGFSANLAADQAHYDQQGNKQISILISKKMALLGGYSDYHNAVGLKVAGTIVTAPRQKVTATIVGIVDDLRMGSVNSDPLAMSFILDTPSESTTNIVLNILPTYHQLIQNELQQSLFKHLKRNDIELEWLNDAFIKTHKSEIQTLSVLTAFTPLVLFLVILGTFGLTSFSTIRRQKEVAMRKVLGASRISIINLLSKEFLGLVFISIAFAFPITYWLVGDWLNNFNERIEQSVWVYLIAAIVVASITWLTVASLAFKAASTRPSLILRDE